VKHRATATLLLGILGLAAGCGDNLEPFGFGFPVQQRERINQLIGFDHDPRVFPDGLGKGVCQNYDGRGFPACYDEHRGSDFMLAGGFDAMDHGSASIVAAAPGVVISVHDGDYDRCHLEGTEVTCDGNRMKANHVIIDHENGYETWYWHMKKGSVAVEEGRRVECGDYLGLIGSSGLSSAPHLHFQVQEDGEPIDPYRGDLSQDYSLWHRQRVPGELFPGPGCTR
jgi:murein DD-endopeptidase MepM/ murein hydrolase activator NlpD